LPYLLPKAFELLDLWFVIVGALLILMGLVSSFTDRLPLTPALIYLLLGVALGPAGAGALRIDAFRHADVVEHVFEGGGSLYYLTFAITGGLATPLAQRLVPLVLAVVAVSIVVHGISATPLMERYGRRRRDARR
jgi:NhaP-type Na+/H+ or K+/H+ antiporter